jgi:hypothetical protein
VQCATWSDYHHFNGAKFLGAVSPCGAFVYSSRACPARATDNAVTELCGFLRHLEKGDMIVADKGFTVFYLLNKIQVSLHMPPFKRVGQTQFSTEEILRTSRVANLRTHVERAFERTKKYKIFDRPLQINMIDLASPLFYVCSVLTNMQMPLVNRKDTTYTDTLQLHSATGVQDKPLPTRPTEGGNGDASSSVAVVDLTPSFLEEEDLARQSASAAGKEEASPAKVAMPSTGGTATCCICKEACQPKCYCKGCRLYLHVCCGVYDESDSGNSCYCQSTSAPVQKACYPPEHDWNTN